MQQRSRFDQPGLRIGVKANRSVEALGLFQSLRRRSRNYFYHYSLYPLDFLCILFLLWLWRYDSDAEALITMLVPLPPIFALSDSFQQCVNHIANAN